MTKKIYKDKCEIDDKSYYVYCCHSILCVWLSGKIEGQ